MKILIKNANLISMDSKREKIEEGIDILIEDKLIKKINTDIKENVDKVIDATGKVVMPGLINTHSHVPMSIFRETVDGYITQDWLEQKIWPMEDKLTKNDIYYASLLSFIEMIKTGTTTINDMYFMTEEIIKAAFEAGIRLQTTRTLMDLTGDGDVRIKELEELIKEYSSKDEKITFNIGIHGFYTSNDAYIPKCVELAKKYNLPIHIHFCENSKEVEDIKKGYEVQSPVELIKRYFKGMHIILAHSVKLTQEEIIELAKEDIYVSHCPVSNLKLGCGIAKITNMQENGITVSLGTDGQGSGSNLDLFETMKFTALLQKGIQENPKLLPAYEVLKMATINGAKALGLEDSIGSITEEKIADIIILNLEEVTTKPLNDTFAEIVYNIKGTNVETTIIGGDILMENRKLRKIDEKNIYEECNQVIYRIQN
ncbi:MAG: amidohydrolase [Clostridia bacterium]|nr:amidohydrolase [Clostridia bacterium]